jgi:Amidohydrolase family
MGFSCPKFLNNAPALLALAVLSGPVYAQAQSQNTGPSRQEQQRQGQGIQEPQPPGQPGQQEPTQPPAHATEPAPAVQSSTSQTGEPTLRLAFQGALELARKNSTQFQAAQEFAYLVKYGMTPAQAIQTATSVASEMMGWQDRMGSIDKGKFADIVAVLGDPLKDITELERISFVMKGGQIVRNDIK